MREEEEEENIGEETRNGADERDASDGKTLETELGDYDEGDSETTVKQ